LSSSPAPAAAPEKLLRAFSRDTGPNWCWAHGASTGFGHSPPVISPGAVATELLDSVTDPDAAARVRKFYAEAAIPADSFARTVAFAISQPDDVDINEIAFRPTCQEY
jgi:hypothetical protein